MSELGHQFDAIFETLVPAESEAPGPVPVAPQLPPEEERAVRRALDLFSEGLYVRCWETLDSIAPGVIADVRVTALQAARRSFETGRLVPGIQVCLGLLEGRDHLPDLYLVLGVLLLKTKQRAQAYEAFRLGVRLAPFHPALHTRLEQMGRRHPPLVTFLPRSHRVNRILGRLRAWLGGLRHAQSAH